VSDRYANFGKCR